MGCVIAGGAPRYGGATFVGGYWRGMAVAEQMWS